MRNGQIGWRDVAEVLAGGLLGLLIWISLSLMADVRAARDENTEQDMQFQRLESLAVQVAKDVERVAQEAIRGADHRRELELKIRNIERQSIRTNYMLEQLYNETFGRDAPELPPPSAGPEP